MDSLFQQITVGILLIAAAFYLGFYLYRQFSSKAGCAACKLKQAASKQKKPAAGRQTGT